MQSLRNSKDPVQNLIFENKEPYSVFKQSGFLKCIARLNPAYIPLSRHTVAEVADEIADECLTEVK